MRLNFSASTPISSQDEMRALLVSCPAAIFSAVRASWATGAAMLRATNNEATTATRKTRAPDARN